MGETGRSLKKKEWGWGAGGGGGGAYFKLGIFLVEVSVSLLGPGGAMNLIEPLYMLPICTHTHTHTHTHLHILTHTHAQAQARTHTHTHSFSLSLSLLSLAHIYPIPSFLVLVELRNQSQAVERKLRALTSPFDLWGHHRGLLTIAVFEIVRYHEYSALCRVLAIL